MPDFRRGMAAMQEAQESQNTGRGEFTPFCRQLTWNDDREEKFIAFLNRADEIPTVELHQFIPVGEGISKSGKAYKRYEQFISRTDTAIGETYDELTDRLGHKAVLRTIAAAVELEPTYTTVNGRKRPTGFVVKTEVFNKKNAEGELEEVEAPLLGVIVQSPSNFFGWVGSFNESTAPIEETPVQIMRRGKDANTAYDFTPFIDQPIDYSNLFDLLENVAYLNDVELNISNEHGLEDALAVGNALLDKKLDELADKERYDKLVGPIEEIEDRWGNNVAPKPRQARPTRVSQRVAVSTSDTASSSTEPRGRNSTKFEELRKIHEAA